MFLCFYNSPSLPPVLPPPPSVSRLCSLHLCPLTGRERREVWKRRRGQLRLRFGAEKTSRHLSIMDRLTPKTTWLINPKKKTHNRLTREWFYHHNNKKVAPFFFFFLAISHILFTSMFKALYIVFWGSEEPSRQTNTLPPSSGQILVLHLGPHVWEKERRYETYLWIDVCNPTNLMEKKKD